MGRPRRRSSKSSNGERMSAAEAKALIAAEEKAALQACHQEIQKVLEKYNVDLTAVPKVIPMSGGGFALSADVQLVTKQQQPAPEGTAEA